MRVRRGNRVGADILKQCQTRKNVCVCVCVCVLAGVSFSYLVACISDDITKCVIFFQIGT